MGGKGPGSNGSCNDGFALHGNGQDGRGTEILAWFKATNAIHQTRDHGFAEICIWLLFVQTDPGTFSTPFRLHLGTLARRCFVGAVGMNSQTGESIRTERMGEDINGAGFKKSNGPGRICPARKSSVSDTWRAHLISNAPFALGAAMGTAFLGSATVSLRQPGLDDGDGHNEFRHALLLNLGRDPLQQAHPRCPSIQVRRRRLACRRIFMRHINEENSWHDSTAGAIELVEFRDAGGPIGAEMNWSGTLASPLIAQRAINQFTPSEKVSSRV